VSIQFAVLESTKRYFAAQNIVRGRGGPEGKDFTAPQLVTAGALAGIANGFVSGPVEHIRIRAYFVHPLRPDLFVYDWTHLGLQTQPSVNPPYAGPWDAVRKITGAHGIAGLFKGQTATFAREAIGYGAYFLAYEKLMQWEMKRKGIKREQVPATLTVLFGAAAGYAVSRLFMRIYKKFGS